MTHIDETLNQILPEKKESTFGSVAILPEEIKFESQNPHEKVFILLRAHFLSNIGNQIMNFITALLPLIVKFVILFYDIKIPAIPYYKTSYLVFFLCVYYTLILTSFFANFVEWYFNIYLITNERIVDFDFVPFSHHKISEAGLASIEDVTQQSIGFLPMLFNYGDVFVQTAAEKQQFDFINVPDPSWVRDKIMDLKDLFIKQRIDVNR